jgi:hypothetical protein
MIEREFFKHPDRKLRGVAEYKVEPVVNRKTVSRGGFTSVL